jgi:hypothetical protein
MGEKVPAPGRVAFNVTGFGPFHGVERNPTSELIRTLPEYLAERSGIKAVRYASFTVVETSGVGALTALQDLALCSTTPAALQDPVCSHPPQLPNQIEG